MAKAPRRNPKTELDYKDELIRKRFDEILELIKTIRKENAIRFKQNSNSPKSS
ncbi:MAG: hypothetical protein HY426_01150 [Candidatus Levybacteria bacterium]|nr:hypothetical protein [Candidatus Levybacteria bacterium]